jgi:hypothetical protein
MARPLDDTISEMGDEKMELAEPSDRLHSQLRQRLLSWSQHALSWLDQRELPVHLMRFEDMRENPVETFGEAVRFLGLDYDTDRVRRAVSFSSFEILRAQELKNGFKEKPAQSDRFFRSGQAGEWRGKLTNEQVGRFDLLLKN